MFVKLFALYPAPAGEDVQLKVAAYIEETRHVPPLVLSHALHRLVRRRGVKDMDRADAFAPPVADILRESARVIRETVLKAEGKDTREYNPNAEFVLREDRWLPEGNRAECVLRGEPLPALEMRQHVAIAMGDLAQRATKPK